MLCQMRICFAVASLKILKLKVICQMIGSRIKMIILVINGLTRSCSGYTISNVCMLELMFMKRINVDNSTKIYLWVNILDCVFCQVVEGQAAVHRCKASVDLKQDEFTPVPATINDEALINHVDKVGSMLLGPHGVKVGQKVMGGEDFAFYPQVIPGVFFRIGIRNDVIGSIYPIHSPYFFLDEDVLPIGAALHTSIAELYLIEHQSPS
ncbi:putative peptidase M20 [Helianthus debilis subsp. tardiflorus]